MKKKSMFRLSALLLCATLLSGLCACGRAQTALPDLSMLGDVHAVSREEGSGTRAEFETLLNTQAAGAVNVALSTEEVARLVGADVGAVGYSAVSALTENAAVRALAVNGVQPDADTIRSGSYPLCRNYYLAYLGELDAVQTDFLAYVLSAGQAIVERSAIPVKDASTFLSDRSVGTITISGSSSVAPLMKELAEDYKTYNPGAEIVMETTDSASGLTAAIRGECDFAMLSRSLKDYEAELLIARDIARDGIALLVNAENPLTDLTLAQIKSLYDGTASTWSELKD